MSSNRDRSHGPQWSWARLRNVCRCGSDLPCQEALAAELWKLAGPSSVEGGDMSLHPFPNDTDDDPAVAEATARRQLYSATSIAAVHQQLPDGWCVCTRNPCTVRATAETRARTSRATLALTGGTEMLPVIAQVSNREWGGSPMPRAT